MKNFYWLTGTFLFSFACSSGEATELQRDLPPVDDFGVRFSGGETADFGNGTDDVCGTSSTDTVISQEQAEQEGLDVEGDRAWLAMPHIARLHYDIADCAAAAQVCDETLVTLRAQVLEPIRVEGRTFRPSAECGEAEWQAFAYRVAVSVENQDGSLAGTFYARVGRRASDAGVVTLGGHALPDLRNFTGELPIELDSTRAHHAFLDIRFSLASDGSASGKLEPRVSYYDEAPSTERIGPDALFDTDGADAAQLDGESVLFEDGERWTVSTYPGSSVEPLVDLRVRAEAAAPAADVELTIRVDGEEVHTETVAAGTSIELGQHPFGTTVSVDVHNANGAGLVGASVLQDNCFAAMANCDEQDCSAHVDYAAAHQLCVN